MKGLVFTIAVGSPVYGQYAVNWCLSVKANDEEQKVAIIYSHSAFKGIEHYLDFFDILIDAPDSDNPLEQAFKLKTEMYDRVTGYEDCKDFEQFLFMDADTLMLPQHKVSTWFGEHKGRMFTAYCNDILDFATGKRTRKGHTFFCEPYKAKEYWSSKILEGTEFEGDGKLIIREMPQIDASYIYFNREAAPYFNIVKIIWKDAFPSQLYKGVKLAEYCFNVASAITTGLKPKIFIPHQPTYRPIYLSFATNQVSLEYILYNFKAIGFAGENKQPDLLVRFYNRLADYYRSLHGIKKTFHYQSPQMEKSGRKIYGFWHICMINHYIDVVSEQLNLLKSSGLYDKADAIYVGCVGGQQQIELIKAIFKDYPKIKILTHKKDLSEYEYPTLKLIEAKAKETNEQPFYGFYIHTKGVSYPNPPYRHGGDMYRAFLNHYVISEWKKCLAALEAGKDLAGSAWIVEGTGCPKHFRGNFWWADSEYIKTLPDISTLDKENRFNAEFWIGRGDCIPEILNPLTELDYNTAPKLVNMMMPKADKRETDMVRPFGINKDWHRGQWKDKNITVLICQRKTKELIQLCLESLLRFYPDIPILVADGDSNDESLFYLQYKALTTPNVKVSKYGGKVIGKFTSHGVTMDEALKGEIKTKYCLLLDSDVIIERGGWIEEMLKDFSEKDVYATGTLMLQSIKGEGCSKPENEEDILRYAHPSCSIIDVEKYLELKPFGDHGAPCIWNMIDAQDRGFKVNYFPIDKYVSHLSGGSWCDPHTTWKDDFGVMIRPFVTFVSSGNHLNFIGINNDNDFDFVYPLKTITENVVIHGYNPVSLKNSHLYDLRFKVKGEYVCVLDKQVTVSGQFMTAIKQRCIELGAPDEFDVMGEMKFVKRQLWQKRDCLL